MFASTLKTSLLSSFCRSDGER